MPEEERQSCPKCGAPRAEATTACPRCGLAVAKMEAYAARTEDVPEALAQAWQRALDDWSTAAHHDELLRLVSQHDAYVWAVARYRSRPDDAMRARQLARLTKATELMMYASAAKPHERAGPTPYRNFLIVVVVLLIAMMVGLFFARITVDNSKPRKAPGVEEVR